MKKAFLSALALAMASAGASATQADTLPFNVNSLAVLGVPYLGHTVAGNMEVKGTFTLPPGLVCDTVYVTTSQAQDPGRAMFSLLRSALLNKTKVIVRLEDTQQAYAGRCHIVAAELWAPDPVGQVQPPVVDREPPFPLCKHVYPQTC